MPNRTPSGIERPDRLGRPATPESTSEMGKVCGSTRVANSRTKVSTVGPAHHTLWLGGRWTLGSDRWSVDAVAEACDRPEGLVAESHRFTQREVPDTTVVPVVEIGPADAAELCGYLDLSEPWRRPVQGVHAGAVRELLQRCWLLHARAVDQDCPRRLLSPRLPPLPGYLPAEVTSNSAACTFACAPPPAVHRNSVAVCSMCATLMSFRMAWTPALRRPAASVLAFQTD